MEQKTFVKSLKLILETGKKQEELIHSCGLYALETVNKGKTTGVDSPIQMLWTTVNQLKSVNRQAFMQWLEAYGCLRFVTLEDKSKVIKYKERKNDDIQALLDEAALVPFWDFAKEPTPNLKPYDVLEALKNVVAQAKSAATGGKDGSKPVRNIEHKELLDVISTILGSPESVREKLGLTLPSELKNEVPTVEDDEEVFTDEMQAETYEYIERLGLRAA